MLDLRGLVVLVDAEEADVQVVARELEVVGVAAEEGDRMFRRKDQANIGVLLEAIEMVESAVIKRDHVTPESGSVERFLLYRVHRSPSGLVRLRRTHASVHRRADPSGHVLDALQNVQFQVHTADLLRERLGVKAFLEQVSVLCAELLEAVGADMMICHDEPVSGDKRAGAAAVETDAGSLQVEVPVVARREVVPLLE